MIRLALALAVWVGFVTAAPAALAARKDGPLFGKEAAHVQAAKAPAAALAVVAERAPASDYVVTEETEVLLNGKPCRYRDVPDSASILRMELGPDNKTVLKIHFGAAPATSPRPSGQ
jgi:hypothetical protein